MTSPTERALQASDAVDASAYAPPTLDAYTEALNIIHAAEGSFAWAKREGLMPAYLVYTPVAGQPPPVAPVPLVRPVAEVGQTGRQERRSVIKAGQRGGHTWGWHCDTLVEGHVVHSGDTA